MTQPATPAVCAMTPVSPAPPMPTRPAPVPPVAATSNACRSAQVTAAKVNAPPPPARAAAVPPPAAPVTQPATTAVRAMTRSRPRRQRQPHQPRFPRSQRLGQAPARRRRAPPCPRPAFRSAAAPWSKPAGWAWTDCGASDRARYSWVKPAETSLPCPARSEFIGTPPRPVGWFPQRARPAVNVSGHVVGQSVVGRSWPFGSHG